MIRNLTTDINEALLVIGLTLTINVTTLFAGYIAIEGFNIILHYHISIPEAIVWTFLCGFSGLMAICFGILSLSIDKEAVEYFYKEWKDLQLTKEFNKHLKKEVYHGN